MTFNEMFGTAQFVSPSDVKCTAPFMRKTFEIEKLDRVKDAQILICGLGVFELYVNGKKVSDDMLVPAFSLYEYRENKHLSYRLDEKYNYRVYVVKYDLEKYLVEGKNSLCVLLGRGWYNLPGNYDENCDVFGNIKLCFNLTLLEGETERNIVSDEDMKWKTSHILYNDFMNGEIHDYRLYDMTPTEADFDDSDLQKVVKADAPKADYNVQTCPADKVIRTIKPKLIHDFGDYKVYDNGENITGFVKVKCDKRDETVVLYHTEEIDENGHLDGKSFNDFRRPQKDTYCTDGKTEMVPHFMWHGFRYFSCTSNAMPVETVVVHADVALTSYFHSDNETLNWLFEAYVRTQLDNMHMGIPSDCPTREKLGYTGDGQLCCDAVMTMFDAKEFYRKWIADLADTQDNVSGRLGHTAPFQGGGGGIGGWGSAMIEVPYMFYSHYGDVEILRQYFPNMIRFMSYMDSRCECGIITGEEKGGWCLGDWGFPDKESEVLLPQNYVNTYFYIKDLDRMCEVALLMGKHELSESYAEKAKLSRRVLKAAYKSPMTDDFCADVAGANCFAIDAGVGTQLTYKNMYEKYNKSKKWDTGIFGADILPRVLFEKGNSQLAFEMLTSHEPRYSFGYMMDCGATTLWEYMNGDASHNHPMFGAPVRLLFSEILGIRQMKGTVGFDSLEIQPVTVKGMDKYEGYMTVPKGRVSVYYEKNSTHTLYKITIPKGVYARFRFETQEYQLDEGENTFDMQIIQ